MHNWPQYDNKHIFHDRRDAGKKLAVKLRMHVDAQTVILSLPRGGVVVGREIAQELQLPHDVLVSRKVGLPGNREFGIGAVSELGGEIFDEAAIELFHPDKAELSQVVTQEREELLRRVSEYRGGRELFSLVHKTVVLVDDGLATGVTARAAIESLRRLHAKRIIFAAPVCAQETSSDLQGVVDEVVCLQTPLRLRSIGHWYMQFDEVLDDEVKKILHSVTRASTFEDRKD